MCVGRYVGRYVGMKWYVGICRHVGMYVGVYHMHNMR